MITEGNLVAAISGEPFSFQYGEEHMENEGIPVDVADYYFAVEAKCELLGLPHGQGWLNEAGWLSDFLVMFARIKKRILNGMEAAEIGNNTA